MIATALVIIVLCTVASAFLFRYLATAAGRRAGGRIASTHRALEEIVERGRVPASWIGELRRKMPGAFARPARRADEAMRFLLGRLAALRSYCTRSSLVDGPDTLALLLDGLARAERQWRERGLEEILAGSSEEVPR